MNRAGVFASPIKNAPTSAIRKVVPQVDCDAKSCEVTLNLGIFFDGTNNNMDRDLPSRSDSNIVRLFNSYNPNKITGYQRVYVPGVGTRFSDIGEEGESNLGKGCAFGCEERVIFGLLAVFNALSNRCLRQNLFDAADILALCRNGARVGSSQDRETLLKLDTKFGLLAGKAEGKSVRNVFLKNQAAALTEKLKKSKPRLVECFLDVFGFSRGAAEARVFCNWLNELLVDGRLAGIPIQFRFVGIIDTVASAGFWSGTKAFVSNSTGGHGAWASAASLRVPAAVQNCVHMLAMHELRRNFPLDAIESSKLRPGLVQYAYPGAHSDVGGGYRPGELGLATGDDSQKLSQIPLNHMLDCAIAAGAPLSRPPTVKGGYDAFAIHPDLTKAFDDFISQSTLAPRPMYEWLQPYLNWRWQIRDRFHTTNQVTRAIQTDREILLTFNKSLINDAAAMTRVAGMSASKRTLAVFTDVLFTGARKDLATTTFLEPEARSVLALAQKSGTTPQPFVTLFDGYVHDSLAGFNAPSIEMPGYWRYRRVFLDTDDHTIASNQEVDATRAVA